MTIFTVVQRNHARIASLLHRMAITTTRGVKRWAQLFAKLKWELTMHTQAEGTVLYSVVGDHPPTRIVAQAGEEHILVGDLLDELEGTSPADPTWSPKLKTIKRNVELHIDEEEQQLFRLYEILNRAQAEMLGEQTQPGKIGFLRPPARTV